MNKNDESFVMLVCAAISNNVVGKEFFVAVISPHQPEGMESLEQHARHAYELYEDVNKQNMIEELAFV